MLALTIPTYLRFSRPFHRSPQAITAQIDGTGLGLSIAERNAEAFGGSLFGVSEASVGSLFTLHLPAWENGNHHARNQSGDFFDFSLAALQLPLKRSEI